MKIAAWNLNHRTLQKPVPPSVSAVLKSLAPDVVVLTEYVEGKGGDDRDALKRALEAMGLVHISLSEQRKGHNQILVATRSRHVRDPLPAPTETHAETNFHPVLLPDLGVTVVGMRAPAYKTSDVVNKYWTSIAKTVAGASRRKLVLVGDLNADPDSTRSTGGRHLRDLLKLGWTIPAAPKPGWSYMSPDGKRQSRVDHLVASPVMGTATASYVTERGGHVVAGPADRNPISDHAILLCEVNLGG